MESDNEEHNRYLPPSDPPSEASDNNTDGVVQTSDDIPLIGLVYHNADNPLSPIHPFPPNLASLSGRCRHHPRSSSLPIPMTPVGGIHHVLGLGHPPLLAPNFNLITPWTQKRFNYEAGQRKWCETLACQKIEAKEVREAKKVLWEENESMRMALFLDQVAEMLEEKLSERGYNLADFLNHLFNPDRKFRYDWQWKSFFAHKATVQRIFNYWTTSKYSQTVRTVVLDFATSLVEKTVSRESQSVTASEMLQKRKKPTLAPRMFQILDAFSTMSRQARDMSAAWFKKKNLIAGSAVIGLLKGASQHNSYVHAINSTYLMATGAQRQIFSVLGSMGITMGYTSIIYQPPEQIKKPETESNPVVIDKENNSSQESDEENAEALSRVKKKRKKRSPGTLYELSQACCKTARRVASTGLFITVYNNINMMFRVAEQIVGCKNAQENGTCATIFPLWNAKPEDMLVDDLHNGIMNAPPLTIDDIQLNDAEADQGIIINHGGPGFNRWQAVMEKCQPVTGDTIEVHKTDVHPLPAFKVDESSTVGNVEVNDCIDDELRLDQDKPEYNRLRLSPPIREAPPLQRLNAGDQLTIARQCALVTVRSGHKDAARAYKGRGFLPGLFHGKMTDIHGLLETHFGKPHAGNRSPGGLAYHNKCLDQLPIILSSLPPFSTARDLVMVSLYSRVLHCLLLVSSKASLDEYLETVTSWDMLHSHAVMIYQCYANADFVQEMWERRIPEEMKREAAQKAAQKVVHKAAKEAAKQAAKQLDEFVTEVEDVDTAETTQPPKPPPLLHVKASDMVFENAQLLLRDQLVSRKFADAVECGDSGRIVLVLKIWACSFCGHGRTKYAHEMLHIIHNLTHVWTKGLRNIILQNWLLNPTGKKNAFIEIDLVQEHLNYWIKKIYKADGDAHSWEWLAMVSPCVDVLRNLAGRMNDDLGSRQGKKHSSPDMKKDINILMASLAKLEVYVEKEGRTLDPDEMPVPDVISVGLADLVHGSALADFNTQFHRNRERRRLVPISSLLNHLETADPISPPSPMQPPQITDAHSVPSPNPSRVMHVQLPVSPIPIEAVVHHVDLPDAADSSDSDEDDFADLDTITR
ncbi:hypothetical protein PILCRDRAFT_9888 [Piloderma croceum F 1598]|uniref:DUF6589 domain-containing protein n=1 Tax=Piloderma croceum (strain F 1598) TaxID=765440 RepID=A0A0C3FJJ5_PILCF|nr:hypothetical protein PILCRDRAFT_9888 [Piloderma croceum F 1598]